MGDMLHTRLKVSMDYVRRMDVLEPTEYLVEKGLNVKHRQWLFRPYHLSQPQYSGRSEHMVLGPDLCPSIL